MRIFGFCDRKDVILWTILNALTAKELQEVHEYA